MNRHCVVFVQVAYPATPADKARQNGLALFEEKDTRISLGQVPGEPCLLPSYNTGLFEEFLDFVFFELSSDRRRSSD